MTSSFSIRRKQSKPAGRSVREIVEHDPGQVSEVWCRTLLRHMLHALERQYAMQLPHRAITPDTIVFHDDGAPLLLPSLVSDPMPDIADDLSALARTVHYAITQEAVPAGPLRGRAPAGYSDSLIAAIDRSMASDPAGRPRTIGELRDILGIVAFRRTPPAAQRMRSQAPPAAPARLPARAPIQFPRWVVAGGGCIVLALAALAVFTRLQEPAALDPIAPLPVPPEPGPAARPLPDPAESVAPVPVLPAPEPPVISAIAPRAHTRPNDGGARAPARHPRSGGASKPAPAPPRAALARTPMPSTPAAPSARPTAAAAPRAEPAGAVFTLQIQPWGAVYVDGVKRGISPPVKQLVLAPGRHAILVTNPGARERVLEVDTARGNGRIAVDFENGPP